MLNECVDDHSGAYLNVFCEDHLWLCRMSFLFAQVVVWLPSVDIKYAFFLCRSPCSWIMHCLRASCTLCVNVCVRACASAFVVCGGERGSEMAERGGERYLHLPLEAPIDPGRDCAGDNIAAP